MTDKNSPEVDRRKFIRTTAAATAATTAFAGAAQGAPVDPDKKLKVGFIGTGGRGTGAALQALSADDNLVLHAVADVFQEKIDKSLEILNKNEKLEGKIDVPAARQFVGLDAYQKVLDSGVDVVLLTTTPGFRPLHLRAAVEAGKHVFAEKPMAVDAAGVRHVYETLKMAEGKPLSIVAGFCWRYSVSRREAMKKALEEGLIGDVTSIYATYYSNHSKPHLDTSLRTDGMTDIEWQIRNWYNYTWLGGGGLVEQAVHSVDKIGWVMGDQNPISCRSTGGLAAPQVGNGNIFDHYHVAFEYPNNVWAHLASRKAPGCLNENADYIRGTKGILIMGRGPDPDQNPISCRSTGGLAAPQVGNGNIFDHYHVAFEYPNNVWAHLASRKAPGCLNENADYIRGTKGILIMGRGPDPYIEDNDGKLLWRYRKPRSGEPNMYQVEHDEFFASIRSGKNINDGPRMIHSSMMAIMGRMSAHTGKAITWEEAMESGDDLFPDEGAMQWDQAYEPNAVAVPGVTEISGIGDAE